MSDNHPGMHRSDADRMGGHEVYVSFTIASARIEGATLQVEALSEDALVVFGPETTGHTGK